MKKFLLAFVLGAMLSGGFTYMTVFRGTAAGDSGTQNRGGCHCRTERTERRPRTTGGKVDDNRKEEPVLPARARFCVNFSSNGVYVLRIPVVNTP